jgi:ElaB/YqjD/DUF883 family membrane-anchored ribosome-binding protein
VETTVNNNGIGADLDELKEGFSLLKQSVTKLLDDVRSEGMRRADDLSGRAKDVYAQTTETIKERPLIVAGVALVVGLVLGRLISNRF